MKGFLELYRVLTRVQVLFQIQYRASNVIWMIGSILEPTIYLVVWSTVAKGEGGVAGGFTPGGFAAYYLTYMLVSHMTFSWIMHTNQFRIQMGQLSFELLRPIHPIHGDIANNIAWKLVMLVVMLPAVAVLAIAFQPTFEPRGWALAVALPAVLLGFLVRFSLEWTLALAAFWTTRITAVNQTYFALLMFLSGRVAPIALLPLWLQDVATTLPFYWMIAFPVELIVGRVGPQEAVVGFGAQLFWVAASFALLSVLWRSAVKRFSAVGG